MYYPPSQPLLDATRPDAAWQKQEVTRLLSAWRNGDTQALTALTPLVYQELRQLAQRYMRRERIGHTLQATAVVHEAFVRMVDLDVAWADRSHFLAIAANMMRRILVDHAKAKHRDKRGGGMELYRLDATNVQLVTTDPSNQFDLVDIDDTLNRLGEVDARAAKVVELYYFGGLTAPEIATAIDISEPTVNRDLRLAKAWLLKELRASSTNPNRDAP